MDHTSSRSVSSTADEKVPSKLDELEVIREEHHYPVPHAEVYEDVQLTWRSWLAVLVSCFAIFSQVFVVTSAPSVIAFIVRDLGGANLSGWIIQAPILMQAALSPFTGRLSDLVDRKYLAGIPPLLGVVGAVISAKAENVNWLIGGGILIGATLSTVSIAQAIPSEVLPLKYRALANGMSGWGGTLGGLAGQLGGGALVNNNPSGWRNIYWLQVGFHGATFLGIMLCYWPQRRSDFDHMTIRELIWAVDPIGCLLLIGGSTLCLIALDWTSTYHWSDPHVVAPLVIGILMLLGFGIYEWKGRTDGLVAHEFFRRNRNFALGVFAFSVEGFIFYSAVAQYIPQITLNLGFENDAWRISVRQLSYLLPFLACSITVAFYSTWRKDLKSPLLVTFTVFLVVAICYSCIQPSWNRAQYALNVLSGIGQAGPLTLLVAVVQFTAPHHYLAGATGLAFSGRAIGGAFGSAILGVVVNARLKDYGSKVGNAATNAGLPPSSVPALLIAFASGVGFDAVPGITPAILGAAISQSQQTYANAYRFAWITLIPFIVLAIISVAVLSGVKDLMTNAVEATAERYPKSKDGGAAHHVTDPISAAEKA
ncbi:MFS general substrate transporter [Atractiella rhizophila]|nr:MFS general substrate transporter [Atractiella rhizophila]